MDDSTFYAVTAQVIPVLWIILVVEMRLYGRAPKRGWQSMEADDQHRTASWWWALILVLIGFGLWIGELDAISALANGKGSGFSREWIKESITFGALYVFLMPIYPWLDALLERVPPLKRFKDRQRERERRKESEDDHPSHPS